MVVSSTGLNCSSPSLWPAMWVDGLWQNKHYTLKVPQVPGRYDLQLCKSILAILATSCSQGVRAPVRIRELKEYSPPLRGFSGFEARFIVVIPLGMPSTALQACRTYTSLQLLHRSPTKSQLYPGIARLISLPGVIWLLCSQTQPASLKLRHRRHVHNVFLAFPNFWLKSVRSRRRTLVCTDTL